MPGDQPPAADAIEHGVLLGDADRRIAWSAGVAPICTIAVVHPVGRARQHRAHHVGIGHEAVGVLMMFVDADAVDAAFGGVNQLIEGPVVVLADFLWHRRAR